MGLSKKKQWELFEEQLRYEIEKTGTPVLLKQVLVGDLINNELNILVRDNYTKNSIERRFLKNLLEFLNKYEEYKLVNSIKFIVNPDKFTLEDYKEQPVSDFGDNSRQEEVTHNLNEKYTFDSFVVGSSNELAHAYAVAVAKEPGTKSNPLFIYGGSGLGKTHLMQAIGHYIFNKSRKKRVTYVSTEEFTNDFIESVQSNRINKFREKYRKIDVLLIDDIQFLTGKEQTQNEFFHTFNVLYEEKKQIVLTSDKPPAKLDKLEERLVSRFKAGLIADIQKPNLELRTAILQKEAKKLNIVISNELIEHIASKVVSNIRELEGAFNTVVSYRSITGKELTEDIIDNLLKDFVSDKIKKVSINDIQKEVADYYSVDYDDLLSQKRDKFLIIPRQMAMYLSRDLTGSSLPQIGKEFGKKDHTTVLHACKKIEQIINEDEDFKKAFQEIRRSLLEN